ncbi:hypothetical protein [Pseudomonas sp. efr-133-TYG-103a]|uniref:hypothetical protein n=1 Tax=Pseudomonas sp. efr-133-TYG-103a TaxID=3040308 RepID=UPI002552801A|nr:hypothetical protein [Pseudomonas sp. efr-133-TYG-103a]
MRSNIDIAAMIGQGVPPSFRKRGLRVCWVVLINGEPRGTAFESRAEAEECRSAWMRQLTMAA